MSIIGAFSRPRSLKIASSQLLQPPSMAADKGVQRSRSQHPEPCPSRIRRSKQAIPQVLRSNDLSNIEAIFVASLVSASCCQQHKPGTGFLHAREPSSPSRSWPWKSHGRRWAGRGARVAARFHSTAALKKMDHMDFDFGSDTTARPAHLSDPPIASPRLSEEQSESEGPNPDFDPSFDPEDVPIGRRRVLPPLGETHKDRLREFCMLVARRVGTVDLRELWKLWESLPTPRLRYVPDQAVDNFLRQLRWVEYRSQSGLEDKYMSILEQCIHEQIRLKQADWNNAVAFAGRGSPRVTARRLKRAIMTWYRMERMKREPDHVTFNILFEAAIKAGNFPLADTLYGEIEACGMPKDRYLRTSTIAYAGLRRDADGVRMAFRDFVNAGEIVSTVIMNVVMTAFMRAGDPTAAEHVFEKMKDLHAQKLGRRALETWQQRKRSGFLLNKAAERVRKEQNEEDVPILVNSFAARARTERLQRKSPIAPDATSYRILIQYHCDISGNLAQVLAYLDEMRRRKLLIHGAAYVHVFRGFERFGRQPDTAWTRIRLETIWFEFLTRLKDGRSIRVSLSQYHSDRKKLSRDSGPVFLTRRNAQTILSAFFRCAGPTRMEEIWQTLRAGSGNMRKHELDALEEDVRILQREENVVE